MPESVASANTPDVSKDGLLGAALTSGLGLGTSLAVRNTVFADCFEGPALGRATGLYQWAYAIGGAAIGWGGAVLADAVGNYIGVLACAVAAAVLWAVSLHLALMIWRAGRTAAVRRSAVRDRSSFHRAGF